MIGTRRELAFVVAFAAVMVSLTACAATTWYVSTSGNDSNSGKTSSAALKTIQKAISKAQNGDTILVNDGSYSSFTLRNSSYQQDVYYELTIKSVNGPFKTTIQGGKVVLGSSWTNQEKATLEGFTIRGGSPAVTGGFVRRCIITGVTGDDFIKEANLYSCIIYGNTVQSSSRGEFVATKVYNCTIYENHGKYIAYDSHGTTFYNSILYGNNQGRYVCSNWGSYAYNCRESDPQCVDLANGNFRLTASSPCINAGNNSYASSSAKDILGNPRIYNSTVDIGAFEYTPPKYVVDTVAAAPRYPWNGLVDLQFKFTETTDNTKGQVTLSAKDVAGNTNLPMRTIRKSNGVAVNTAGESLSPGTYRWGWDAAADLPKDFKRERVTVSVKVTNVTGTSSEFRVDLSGMGPWEMRTARAGEVISYSSAWATNAMSGAKAVVKVWPVKREKPKYIAIDLSGGTTAAHYPIEYLDEIPGGTWSDEYKTSKLVLRHIPAGSFIMGGRATDYPGAVNTNLHMVTLTRDFYMGVFEVTQRQWELVMGNRPSWFTNDAYYATRPVEQLSYVDIRGAVKGVTWPNSKDVDDGSFMWQLRNKIGLTGFDLPTEAQWEYACRAGTATAYNSGRNIDNLDGAGFCETANEVARYYGNSGIRDSNLNVLALNQNCGTDKGTAVVGSYRVNDWGLHDMHGNVWEFCLDSITNLCASGSIDPVGDGCGMGWRVYRGGSFANSPGGICSANRWTFYDGYPHGGFQENDTAIQIGFRLCLQDGELPELDGGTVLVNEAGTGTANWTPTKVGIYYLTHETQTNGVNGAELLGAWFEVAGPELTFEPDGELVPGVKIAINGAGDGWHIYYTMDGSAPTQSPASEYSGPITLNDSATIRAIAFSDGGVESREFSAAYSLMSVAGAVAKPRYPWNGKVDVDVTVKGDTDLEYLVSLAALDLDGNTNLPVRTVAVATSATLPSGTTVEATANGKLLPPGQYRFTWDADADIAGDFDFANVAVSVSAEGSAIIAARKVLPLEVAGYTGSETLTNVPVLVRLSTAINGFSYADFADANGGDLIFTDESGSVVYLHEIDEWHTNGESLVWVKLPTMASGTRFKAAYGNSQLATHNSQLSPHEVWREYAGVWHMNEDSGTAFDSTTHGLDAFPEKWTNRVVVGTTAMMAYENGACGRARQNETIETSNAVCGNYLLVPSYDALALGSKFSVSAWFRADQVVNFPRMIARKNTTSEQGWEIHPRQSSTTNISLRGSASNHMIFDIPDMLRTWVSITAVFDGSTFSCYTNGVQSIGMPAANGETTAAVDNGLGLGFGSIPRGQGNGWCGQYDEIRLRGGSLSADRIKADYDMVKNRNFLSYGPVSDGRGI